jgi:hypothetical protein
MREKDQLDLLIDAAAATYAEPRAGLENRILLAISMERQAVAVKPAPPIIPRRPWLPWALALSAAACLLLVTMILSNHTRRGTQTQNVPAQQARHESSGSALIASATPHAANARILISRPRRHTPSLPPAPLPKLDVFPTPQPLTPQEQALVTYATRASSPQLQALVAAQKEVGKPLNIAAINIPPLESPDEGN